MTVKMPLLLNFLRSFFCHPGQQAEVVFLNGLLSAPSLKLTLGAMPIQDEIGRRRDGQHRGYLPSQFPHLARQRRGLHLQRGLVVPVDDLAQADFTAQHFRQHVRIERQQQLIVPIKFVGEDESNRGELAGLASPF